MFEGNPLYHHQLKKAYRSLENSRVHLGVADKFLFKCYADRRIEQYLEYPASIDFSGIKGPKSLSLEDVAILDALIEVIPYVRDEYAFRRKE
ncbi:MAG: hypothetical protein HGA85_02175 [Nanoarchaeota archaeon]|nr:hypothetical protein [Nanoarchaeota archaeon]